MFSYNTGSESNDDKYIVPPLKTFAQDHWGYYLHSDLVNTEIPYKYSLRDMMNGVSDRFPTPGYASLGLLKKIEFPSNEHVTLEYEQNLTTWETYGTNPNPAHHSAGGVRVKKTISNISGETQYEYVKENGVTSGWGSYEGHDYDYRTEVTNVNNNQGYDYGGEKYFEVAWLQDMNDIKEF